jgi:ABC-2 type transport system ATP-binding protein
LEVKKGEIFALLGPSGAGKTTTINLFTAQQAPSIGNVEVLGKEVINHREELFAQMGILTDSSGLYERLSIKENLMLYARFFALHPKRVDEIVNQVGLTNHINKPVGKLSKGMKQRVLIARAVLHQPKILFLDEPTAALDPGTTLDIHKLIKQLNKEGTTVFLTTHDMFEADKLCDRVAFLNEGQIIDVESPKKLKLKYAIDAIHIGLEDGTYHTVKKDPLGGKQIEQWLSEGKLKTLHSQEPNLEQIFLTLTGKELA